MNLDDAVEHVIKDISFEESFEAVTKVLGPRIGQAYCDLHAKPLTDHQYEQLNRVRDDIKINWKDGVSTRVYLSFWNDLGPEEEAQRDTHTEHCCVDHGCKYNDDQCPVISETKRQTGLCQDCNDHDPEWLDLKSRDSLTLKETDSKDAPLPEPKSWRCLHCGNTTYVLKQPLSSYELAGEEIVFGLLSERKVCTECGDYLMMFQELQVKEFEAGLRLLKAGRKDARLFNHCRRVIGLQESELAERLGVPVSEVKDWEKNGSGTAMAALALRMLLSDAYESFKTENADKLAKGFTDR